MNTSMERTSPWLALYFGTALKVRAISKRIGSQKPDISVDALRKLLIIPRSPSPDLFDALPAAERERLAREAFQRQQVTNI